MSLNAGTRVGPYEISSLLGKGGVGEVYRARDTKLGRDVAIKVLPEELAADEERVARFEREARLLASLNHPNIPSIYGLESNALVLELVEGPTLAERIQKGPMPVDDAIAVATQVARALEAGHEAGIIHRDLKPANIKLKDDTTVKVLDYGLAKALEGEVPAGTESELSQSPTLTRHGTEIGVILGTAAYMSPEQAKGKPVDRRADIWAFGAVLYEMLTGKRAFAGEDVSDTLATVIRADPDFGALPDETPASLRLVLRLCLSKDVTRRFQSIGDVRLAMEGAFGSLAPPRDVVPHARGLRPSSAVAGALALSVLTGIVVWRATRPAPTSRPVARFSLPLRPGDTLAHLGDPIMALSSDGTRFVYSANGQLYLRNMDRMEETPIRGTEGGAINPFFSPDGEWVGFWVDGQIKKVAIRGGAPVRLCDAPTVRGAWWSSDDTIVFGRDGNGIMQVSADGGTPEVLVPLDARGEIAYGPQLLPGGKAVLFTLGHGSTWDKAQVVTHSLETGERRVLIERGNDARYVATGHLVYHLDEALYGVPFDADTVEVTGGPIPVLEGIRSALSFSGAAQFSFSDTGALVYLHAARDPEVHTLAWVDRDGTEEALSVEPRPYAYPRISPDGSRLAVSTVEQGAQV